MSHAAFLLAPVVPVPERLPDEPHRVKPYDQAVHDWDPSTGEPSPEERDHPDPFAHQPPRDASLQRLLNYRGLKFKPVRRPAGLGFLGASAKAKEFTLGESRGDELGRLRAIAHAYGGDHVALWTFGDALHLWVARSAAPGATPRVWQLALRSGASAGARPAGLGARIAGWLQGSMLAPDLAALERALAAPTLSESAFFAAFGIAGVKDSEPPDVQAAWSAFEQVADALLRGAVPDATMRKAVTALIDDSESQLPAKAPAKRSSLATRVASAYGALRDVLGAPATPRLAACARAAALYDAITSGPAGDRLLQTRDKPLAIALALGRLLAHYPVEVRRDPLFLALASHEAEVWNGHGFVAPLAAMAAEPDAPGFIAAIVPAQLEEDFRAAHDTASDGSAALGGWAGEAAIANDDRHVATFTKWFAKKRADGAIVHGQADGTCRMLRLVAGQLTEDAPVTDPRVVQAARALDPRAAIVATGFPDVLAPGELAQAPLAEVDVQEALTTPAMVVTGPDDAGPLPPPVADWAPPRVVLETARNLYVTADLARLAWYRDTGERMAKQLAARYPGRVDPAASIAAREALALLDEAVRAAGFTPLGDILSANAPGCALRGYTQREGSSSALLVALPGRPLLECEFRTRLADGTEVLTSSIELPLPTRAGASVRRLPLAVPALWTAHQQHVEEVRGARAAAPAPASLEAFAQSLEP